MNSVYSDVCLGQRQTLYRVPIRLWHLDWDVRPLALEGISGAIYVAIVWPEGA